MAVIPGPYDAARALRKIIALLALLGIMLSLSGYVVGYWRGQDAYQQKYDAKGRMPTLPGKLLIIQDAKDHHPTIFRDADGFYWYNPREPLTEWVSTGTNCNTCHVKSWNGGGGSCMTEKIEWTDHRVDAQGRWLGTADEGPYPWNPTVGMKVAKDAPPIVVTRYHEAEKEK